MAEMKVEKMGDSASTTRVVDGVNTKQIANKRGYKNCLGVRLNSVKKG